MRQSVCLVLCSYLLRRPQYRSIQQTFHKHSLQLSNAFLLPIFTIIRFLLFYFLIFFLTYIYIITYFFIKIKKDRYFWRFANFFGRFGSDGGKQKTAAAGSKITLSGSFLSEPAAAAFLFPVLKYVIQGRIQRCFHAFLYQAHDFSFKHGLLFLLPFFLLVTHLIFTSLVM